VADNPPTIQEMLVMGSVGAVILDLMQKQLVDLDGVPLGLIGADKSVGQLSFFWSIEFWASFRSYHKRPFAHAYIILLLVIGGIMALLVGPATAVLMIPREMNWPTGGAIFWLNGA
jgi:hypothetical protein